MDKRKWEYKKLGDVCSIERGGSPRPISDYITDAENGINWIKIGDAVEGSKYIMSTAEKIKPEGMKKSRFVHKGDFILSNSMSFGKPYILGVDGCIHDGWLVIHDDSNTFNKNFLYYYLGSPTIYSEFKRLAVGGVVNNLNSNLVRGVKVAIPPLSEQLHIVEELDLLSSIIEKKKAQFNELDNLAQSLFYEMFGDPETNNKQWETKKLSKITKSEGGGTPSKNVAEYWGGDIVWVSSKDMKQTYISDSIIHITEEGVANSPAHLLPIGTILIVNRSGILKHTLPVAITTKELTINQDIKALVVNNEGILNIYLLFCIIAFSPYLLSKVKAVTVDSIDFSIFKSLDIPLPPLNLQQQFASKIEAIEHQKELIKHSIKEVETLFNSRMDYYFN